MGTAPELGTRGHPISRGVLGAMVALQKEINSAGDNTE